MRAMTGFWVVELNSVLLASDRPRTLRANSIAAHCIPRQMPKNGIPLVLAYRIASIFPSIPLIPNPPGTSRPSTPARTPAAPSRSISSASIRRTTTLERLAIPAWSSDS